MATVREHLKLFHQESQRHHEALAKEHAQLAYQHGTLADGTDGEASKIHRKIGASHAKVSEHHASLAVAHQHHATECEKSNDVHDLSKAVLEQLGSKIVPDNVRATIPSNVPGAGVTAVPRNGQPDLAINLRDVPPEFEQFLKIEG